MTIFVCGKCNSGAVNTAINNKCSLCGWDSTSTEVFLEHVPGIFKFKHPKNLVGYGYGKKGLKDYGVFRYARGQWLPAYDGEPDMAFIGYTPGGMEGGAPVFYGVDMSSNKNGNHHFHPNTVAYNAACDKCCELNSCASGYEINTEDCIF